MFFDHTGLDAAGKTTALYTLKLGEVVTTIPTIGKDVKTETAFFSHSFYVLLFKASMWKQ